MNLKMQPMKGQRWYGKVARDITVEVTEVNPKINTVFGIPTPGDRTVIAYRLDTWHDYYEFPVRSLAAIAHDIDRHWSNVWFGAVPYLDAMRTLDSIREDYYADSAESVVLYFLGNAQTWKGDDARRIKAELKAMLKTV